MDTTFVELAQKTVENQLNLLSIVFTIFAAFTIILLSYSWYQQKNIFDSNIALFKEEIKSIIEDQIKIKFEKEQEIIIKHVEKLESTLKERDKYYDALINAQKWLIMSETTDKLELEILGKIRVIKYYMTIGDEFEIERYKGSLLKTVDQLKLSYNDSYVLDYKYVEDALKELEEHNTPILILCREKLSDILQQYKSRKDIK